MPVLQGSGLHATHSSQPRAAGSIAAHASSVLWCSVLWLPSGPRARHGWVDGESWPESGGLSKTAGLRHGLSSITTGEAEDSPGWKGVTYWWRGRPAPRGPRRSDVLRACKAALRGVQAAPRRQPALGGVSEQPFLWARSSPTSSGRLASHFSSLLSSLHHGAQTSSTFQALAPPPTLAGGRSPGGRGRPDGRRQC